jgi:hypothetical protein
MTPRVKNPPGGRIMITHGSKCGPRTAWPRKVPLPRISRTDPIMSSATMKPMPEPTASRIERHTVFFEANASWRPRIMQFTTISAMNAPSSLWITGTTALSTRSAMVTNVAMMRM